LFRQKGVGGAAPIGFVLPKWRAAGAADRGLASPRRPDRLCHCLVQKVAKQNTIDLQWKMRANYNARPCDGERKAAGAGTMASNGKNNAQKQWKQRKMTRY
jgi:hypothetical protein